jgi:hypothetical protein
VSSRAPEIGLPRFRACSLPPDLLMLGGIPDRGCSGVGVLETIGGKARRHRDIVR